ncbi:NfeD family protein [Micrococcales bacterium 31B]|nr:NfeD family protein [Micrococcales bacterium 31B]
MDDMQWLLWLAAAIILGIIEIFTVDLIFAMLAVGAVGGAIAAGLGAPWWASGLVAIVLAVLMFLFVRPRVLHRLRAMPNVTPTNIDRMIGEIGTVLESVSGNSGLVKLPGGEWTARTTITGSIPRGTIIYVERIDGATAMVLPKDNAQPMVNNIKGVGA